MGCRPLTFRARSARAARARRTRGRALCLAIALLASFAWLAPTRADEPEPAARERRGAGDEQVFDFTGLEIGGRLRTPQLLYFLDRAREELRQASLERRSFLPEMVRSIDEESL